MRPKAISGPASAATDLPNRGDLGVEVFRHVVDGGDADCGQLLDESFVGQTSKLGAFAQAQCAVLEARSATVSSVSDSKTRGSWVRSLLGSTVSKTI
jgi:hypothetical protein